MKREVVSLSKEEYVVKAGEHSTLRMPGPFETEEQALSELKAHMRRVLGEEGILVLPDGSEVSVIEEVSAE